MNYSKVCWILLVLVSTLIVNAWPDDQQNSGAATWDLLIPQTGHPLFGTLKTATGNEIVFVLDSGLSATVTWEQVKELRACHKTTLQAKKALDSTSGLKSLDLESPMIRANNESLMLVSSAGSLTVPRVDVVSISQTSPMPRSPEAPPSSTAWIISVAPKVSLSSGTQTQQTLGAQIFVRRNQDGSRTDWHHQVTTLTLDGNNSLAEQAGSASIRTHEYDGRFTHAVYFWRRLHADIVAEGYHNSSLNLYLQQDYGGGLGGKLFSNSRNSLELTGDLLHIDEHFYGTVPSVGFVGASLTQRYAIKLADLAGGPLEITESGSYIPAFNQKKAWQARGTAMLIIPIRTNLSANFTFSDNYLENAPNARKNYSTSSGGLTYTFPPPK